MQCDDERENNLLERPLGNIYWINGWINEARSLRQAFRLILQRLPSGRWKTDLPETRSRSGERHRDQVALLIFRGGSRHSATLLLQVRSFTSSSSVSTGKFFGEM